MVAFRTPAVETRSVSTPGSPDPGRGCAVVSFMGRSYNEHLSYARLVLGCVRGSVSSTGLVAVEVRSADFF